MALESKHSDARRSSAAKKRLCGGRPALCVQHCNGAVHSLGLQCTVYTADPTGFPAPETVCGGCKVHHIGPVRTNFNIS